MYIDEKPLSACDCSVYTSNDHLSEGGVQKPVLID